MNSCPMPRGIEAYDTPHGQAPDMQRDTIARAVGLDLEKCNVYTIVTALNEFDLKRLDKLSHRFETWPDDVQAKMRKELALFDERNGGARIEAITQAIGADPKCFILCLHWRPKA